MGNRRASGGAWPDTVDFPVYTSRLVKGDTLYIPAYHWHFVSTITPPSLGIEDDGPLAVSVNFWWWPVHNLEDMERWSYEHEIQSWANRRIAPSGDQRVQSRESHAVSFYRLNALKLAETLKRTPRSDATTGVVLPRAAGKEVLTSTTSHRDAGTTATPSLPETYAVVD